MTQTAANVALLAPVPLVHLKSGIENQGTVAFGSRASKIFRELDVLREGQPVDVYIYASLDPDGGPFVSWRATYIRHVENGDEDVSHFRPESTKTDTNDSALFWLVTDLRRLEHPTPVAELTGYENPKRYGHPFVPQGPIIIEHPLD